MFPRFARVVIAICFNRTDPSDFVINFSFQKITRLAINLRERLFLFDQNKNRFAIEVKNVCMVVSTCMCCSRYKVCPQPESGCSALIEVLLLFSEGHLLHHPPLPPIFYSQWFSTLSFLPFRLASRVTANIVFLVYCTISVRLHQQYVIKCT